MFGFDECDGIEGGDCECGSMGFCEMNTVRRIHSVFTEIERIPYAKGTVL